MRSTIHAVCCGTKRTTVLVGVRLEAWKYVGVPDEEPSCPPEEKMVGVPCEEPALCTLSWLKARTEEAVVAATRGDVRAGSGPLAVRMRPEAVEAARRVRDAILWDDEAGRYGVELYVNAVLGRTFGRAA
jgi:hypothetical protein